MKFHKAILVGQTETSASLISPGVITASQMLVGDIRITAESLDYYDSASGDFVNIISDRSGSYILTSSITDFPLEVSRSAAEFGFGQGGGGNIDSAVITASAQGDTITFVKGNLSTFDVRVISSGSIETASVAERLEHSLSNGQGISPFIFLGTDNQVVTLDTSSTHFLAPIDNAVDVLSGSASTSRNAIASDITALSSSASTSRNAIVASISGAFEPTNTGSFLITASVSSNVITFTKGDATTFDLIINTGSGGGGTGSGFPFTGEADIFGTLAVEKTTGFTNDLLLIKGDTYEGEVSVNQQGVLNLKWSGSAPPTVVEGGLYYSSSALYVGI